MSSQPPFNNNNGEDANEGWKRVNNRWRNRSGESYADPNAMHGTTCDNLSENQNPKSNIFERMSMTFFVTNFPAQITSKEMWNRCLQWSTVVDVFIANRKSKSGKRFGFVRFIKVGDAEKVLLGLRSIWFGSVRLFADVEKYPRKIIRKVNQSHVPHFEKTADGSVKVDKVLSHNASNQKSYAEVVSNGNGKGTPSPNTHLRVVTLSANNSVSTQDPFDLVMKIIEPKNVPYVRQWFHDEGFFDVEFSYVGGRWIHVSFNSHEAKDLFMTNESLKCRFSTVMKPSTSFVPDERMVWVEISGVPKGAWNNENFQVIMGSWGKCVFGASDWIDSFSLAKVCNLSKSPKFIYEEFKVVFDDKPYDIWIREFDVWEPDILKINHDSESDKYDKVCTSDNSIVSNGDTPSRSDSFDLELCKDHSNGDCGNDDMKANAQNSNIPVCDEELSFLERNSVKKEHSTHYNNGLDDHDVILLNRLLKQDKCQVRPVKALVNENSKVSSDASLKQDQSSNEVTGNEKHNQEENQPSSSVISPSTPPATDINLVVESCSTWLDYIGSPTDEKLDSEKIWSYKDPDGNVKGPFSLAQLNMWKDYFSSDFKIWRYYGNVKDNVLLHNALKRRRKKDVG